MGPNAGNQGQNGNKFFKTGNNNGGNQGNKGKGSQGYNGNFRFMNGNSKDFKYEQGKSSKNEKSLEMGNSAGAVLKKKGNLGNNVVSRGNQEVNKKDVSGKKDSNRQSYVPKSGADLKISSNFDRNFHTERNRDSVNLISNNKFDVLNDLEDENQFVFKNGGIPEVDLDYLDNMDQMEVIGGIPLVDTNMEVLSNDASFWNLEC